MDVDRKRVVLSRLLKAFGFILLIVVAVPFFLSLTPSDRADSIGAPIEIDLKSLSVETPLLFEWRGRRFHVLARSFEDVQYLRGYEPFDFFEFDRGPTFDRNVRSVRDDVFVVEATCPHGNCEISIRDPADFSQNDPEYFGDRILWDPCHGWLFDLAGRYIGETEYARSPVPDRHTGTRSLSVPDYRFISESTIELGRR